MSKSWLKYGKICGTWKGRKLVLCSKQPDLIGPHITIVGPEFSAVPNSAYDNNVPGWRWGQALFVDTIFGNYQFRYVSGGTKIIEDNYAHYSFNSYRNDWEYNVARFALANINDDLVWLDPPLPGYHDTSYLADDQQWWTLESCAHANFLKSSAVYDIPVPTLLYFHLGGDDFPVGSITYHVFKVP